MLVSRVICMLPFQPKNICVWFIQIARQFSLLNLALHGYMVIYIPALLWIAAGVIFHLGVLQTMLSGRLLCCCDPVSLVVLSGAGVLEIGLCISHSYTHQRAAHTQASSKSPFCSTLFSTLGVISDLLHVPFYLIAISNEFPLIAKRLATIHMLNWVFDDDQI